MLADGLSPPVGTGVINTLCECSPGGPGVPMGGGSNKPPDFGGEAGVTGSSSSPPAEDSLGLRDVEGPMLGGKLGAPDGVAPATFEGDGDGDPETDVLGPPGGGSGKRRLLMRRCLETNWNCHSHHFTNRTRTVTFKTAMNC